MHEAGPWGQVPASKAAPGRPPPSSCRRRRRPCAAAERLLAGSSPRAGLPSASMALQEAARLGETAEVAALLDAGAAVDVADTYQRTALAAAAANGHVDVMRLLLRAGASPLAADVLGELPLHKAARGRGTQAAMQLLLEAAPAAAVTPSAKAQLPLHEAAVGGNAAAARALLAVAPQATVFVDSKGGSPLRHALFLALFNPIRGKWTRTQRPLRATAPYLATARAILAVMPPDHALNDLYYITYDCYELRSWNSQAGPFGRLREYYLHPLYAHLAASTPLSPQQWACFPVPCAGLGTALPAVLASLSYARWNSTPSGQHRVPGNKGSRAFECPPASQQTSHQSSGWPACRRHIRGVGGG